MKSTLKTTKLHLKNILSITDWKVEQSPNGQLQKISGLNNIRSVIKEIESLNLFESVVSNLKNSVLYTTSKDSLNVQNNEVNIINSQLNILQILAQSFLNLLLKIVPDEDPNSINIKLPEIKDFDDLSKVSRDIHLGLTQVIMNDEINGHTDIVSVENGSIWFNVFVGVTAVPIIASLVWSSAVIYKKIQEGKLLEQQVRGLKVKNDSLDDILKAQKAETAILIQAEAENINSEHFKVNIPENIERIKNSISTFADLIGRGAEIHPALIAPEKVSNLFPDPTKMISIESKIKKLANPSNN